MSAVSRMFRQDFSIHSKKSSDGNSGLFLGWISPWCAVVIPSYVRSVPTWWTFSFIYKLIKYGTFPQESYTIVQMQAIRRSSPVQVASIALFVALSL